jgi:hypothetical protein
VSPVCNIFHARTDHSAPSTRRLRTQLAGLVRRDAGLAGPLKSPGRLDYWKSRFVHELSDAAIDTMIANLTAVPSPLSPIALEHFGSAVGRVGKDDTAFNEQDAPSAS